MDRRLVGWMTFLAVILNLVLMSIPVAMSIYRHFSRIQSTERYEDTFVRMEERDVLKQINLARWYNLCLQENWYQEDQDEAYQGILNISEGMMGYLKSTASDVKIPIYHNHIPKGSDYALVHLTGTSFPVGGKGNHTLLTGPEELLHMKENDVFYIHIAGQELYYRIENVVNTSPGDISGILPVKGEDRCTLIISVRCGTEERKAVIRGIRCTEINPEEQRNLPEYLPKLCAASIIMTLGLPVLSGCVGNTMRWTIKKLYCCRLPN